MNFANKHADRIVKEITEEAAPVVVLSVVVGVVVGSVVIGSVVTGSVVSSPEPSVVSVVSVVSHKISSTFSAASQPSTSRSLTEAAETKVAAMETKQIKATVFMMCVSLSLIVH